MVVRILRLAGAAPICWHPGATAGRRGLAAGSGRLRGGAVTACAS